MAVLYFSIDMISSTTLRGKLRHPVHHHTFQLATPICGQAALNEQPRKLSVLFYRCSPEGQLAGWPGSGVAFPGPPTGCNAGNLCSTGGSGGNGA